MEKVIIDKLREIELRDNIRILLAVESGSRAWGFPSPDSDYDVRFIYVRNREDYLRLDSVRDVIELPINNLLDINGWDLQKTLRLLYKGNPTLFEWLLSPIVYVETESANRLRVIMNNYFSRKRSLYHYISMAEGNYHDYLKRDMVKAKKYFYVLRPVLACKWILDKGCRPPVQFSELVNEELPQELRPDLSRLVDLKINSPEIKEIPRIDAINKYLNESIEEIKMKIASVEDKTNNWEELNCFFLREISC